MKKLVAVLCVLASVVGALWFCVKFAARLGIRSRNRHMVHEWPDIARAEKMDEKTDELEKRL